MASIFGDVTRLKNSGEGFHQTPPPPPGPLYHGGGMNLRVRRRVKTIKKLLEGAFVVVTLSSSQLSRTLLANCNILIVAELSRAQRSTMGKKIW